jgi:hypothetical protein
MCEREMMTRAGFSGIKAAMIVAAAGLGLSVALAPAMAQQPAPGGRPALGGGRALDANSRVGGDGTNARGQDVDAIIRFNNAVITGQAGGGKSFRGPINYRAVNEFSGPSAGDSTYRFNRDSAASGLAGSGIRSSDLLNYQIAASSGRSTGGLDPRLSQSLTPSRGGVSTGDSFRTARSISEFQSSEARRPTVLGVQQAGDSPNRSIITASRLTGIRQQRMDETTADRLGLFPAPRAGDPQGSRSASAGATPISDRLSPTGATPSAGDASASAGSPARADTIRTGYDAALERLKAAAQQGGLNPQTEAIRAAREPRDARDAREPRATRTEEAAGVRPGELRPLSPGDPKNDDLWRRELQKLRERLSAERADTAARTAALPEGGVVGPRLREDLAGLPRAGRDRAQPGGAAGSGSATGIPTVTRPTSIPTPTGPGIQGPGAEQPGLPGPATDAPRAPRTPWDEYYERVLLKALRESGRGERVKTMAPADANEVGQYASLMRRGEEAIKADRSFDAEAFFSQAMSARASGDGDVLARAGRVHAQLGAGLYLSASTALRVLVTDHPEMLGVRYDPTIIMTSPKFQKVTTELRAEIGKGMTAMGDNAALLLAYIGYQLDDGAMVREGLARLDSRRSQLDYSMIELLDAARAVWGDRPIPDPQPPTVESVPMAPLR